LEAISYERSQFALVLLGLGEDKIKRRGY
jgi:hypothetical protein